MYKLSINTGFAVNRYMEPSEWIKIIGKDCGLRFAQLTASLINPALPESFIKKTIDEIKLNCEKYDVKIHNTFTDTFTRLNHLAHPSEEVRNYWVDWFKKFVDISVSLGADSMGSHLGIFTHKDNSNIDKRAKRLNQNIECWHDIAAYAKDKGLKFLTWEPMSISREQGETINKTKILQKQINENSPLPFKICLDVDHGDVTSKDPDDTNPYKWLEIFANESPHIHIKQSTLNKGGHWPFTKQFNQEGKIQPEKILNTLNKMNSTNNYLVFELSFREREPTDSTVVEVLQESVNYWREYVTE